MLSPRDNFVKFLHTTKNSISLTTKTQEHTLSLDRGDNCLAIHTSYVDIKKSALICLQVVMLCTWFVGTSKLLI